MNIYKNKKRMNIYINHKIGVIAPIINHPGKKVNILWHKAVSSLSCLKMPRNYLFVRN